MKIINSIIDRIYPIYKTVFGSTEYRKEKRDRDVRTGKLEKRTKPPEEGLGRDLDKEV